MPTRCRTERELTADTVRFTPSGAGTDPYLASNTPTVLEGVRGREANFDLRSLSVFAADGRFVNLVHLRNRFDAPHGIDDDEMSDSPVLYGVNGNALPEENDLAQRAKPANYASNQLHVFRPASDPDHEPGDRRYALNSFADADGDGDS